MRSFVFLLQLFCLCSLSWAQTESVQYVQGFNFKQGIYLNFAQFRNNAPVPKSALVFEADTTRLDFIKLALSKDAVHWKDSSGKIQTTKTTSLWGYSENNGVYTRMNYAFNRIVVIGSLCHFTSYVTTYMYTGPGTYPDRQNGTPSETLQQYVLDTQIGSIYEFNVTNMDFLLQRDSLLHAEFSALKKRKKKEQMFIYLRKYNEKHLLHFPK